MDREWVDHLSKRMYDAVMSRIPDVTLNGDHDKRYPGNLNFSFAYVEVRACAHLTPCRGFRGNNGWKKQRWLQWIIYMGYTSQRGFLLENI